MRKGLKNLDNEFTKIVGETLKDIRLKKNMSLEDVCKKTTSNLQRQRLSDYETNKYKMTNMTFQTICFALGESPEDVYDLIIDNFNAKNGGKKFNEQFGVWFKRLDSLGATDKISALVDFGFDVLDEKTIDLVKKLEKLSEEYYIVLKNMLKEYYDLSDDQLNKVIEYIEFLKSKN